MLGVFDSGVGGLTVLKELEEQLPNADLIFFGDSARAPYGTKGPKTVQHFATEAVDLLKREGATAFVVACHTMSAVAMDAIREAVTGAPVFDVVTATVAAVQKLNPKRIGVIGTNATVNSRVYERAFAPRATIQHSAPLLVPLIEEGWTEKPEAVSILHTYLEPFKGTVDALILGCTHYPLLREAIAKELGPKVQLVDPSREVATAVATAEIGSGSGKRRYLFSDITSSTKETTERWLGHPVALGQASAERA